jgi:hypothetical protein
VKLMDFGMSNYMYLQCLYEAKESNWDWILSEILLVLYVISEEF